MLFGFGGSKDEFRVSWSPQGTVVERTNDLREGE